MDKRKRNVLNLKQKNEIILRYQRGDSVTNLAKKYNIGKSTVCGIIKNKSKIESLVDTSYEVVKRKTIKSGRMPKVESKLYEWFCVRRKKNLPVTTDLIKERAKLINNEIKEDEQFCASDGWLQNFKKRFGIRFLKISGEKLSSSSHLVAPFKREFQNLILNNNLLPNQIYNADESGLFWRMLTSKTLVKKDEKVAPGRKSEKASLTFLACTNASGDHKVKPLVIGKAKRPRCFKNFDLPVDYKSSKNAWMTCRIFEDWFKHSFIPQVKKYLNQKGLPIKAVLLLDNAPCHPPADNLKSEDGKIFAVFMPPNVTPLIQPMDQNIIRITKMYYKSSLLSSVVSSKDPISMLKKVSIKDAIINLRLAWNRLEPMMIQKCWTTILQTNEDFDREDDIPLSILRDQYKKETEAATAEVRGLISQLGSEFECSIEEILSENGEDICGEDVHSNSAISESDSETETVTNKICTTEVVDAFNTVITWAEENCSVEEMMLFRKCREEAIRSNITAVKVQKKLTDFFK